MVSEETHKLLVAVRADTDDAEEGLDRVNKKFDETADETEKTAGVLGDISNRMKGFGAVMVGTLTTLAAGIATQVPVIQENASALGAVVDAISLRIDNDLRPSMTGLNRDLFELADAIATGERELEAWTDVLGRVLNMVGSRLPGPVGGFIGLVGDIVTKVDDVTRAFTDLPSAIEGGLQRLKRVVHDNLVMPVITGVRDAIKALNRLPGADFDTPNLPTPPRSPFTPNVPETGGGEDFGHPGGLSAQKARLIEMVTTGTVETEVNIDSRKVGQASKPFAVRGVLGRRGFPGE